jgi:hypothetical protein
MQVAVGCNSVLAVLCRTQRMSRGKCSWPGTERTKCVRARVCVCVYDCARVGKGRRTQFLQLAGTLNSPAFAGESLMSLFVYFGIHYFEHSILAGCRLCAVIGPRLQVPHKPHRLKP